MILHSKCAGATCLLQSHVSHWHMDTQAAFNTSSANKIQAYCIWSWWIKRESFLYFLPLLLSMWLVPGHLFCPLLTTPITTHTEWLYRCDSKCPQTSSGQIKGLRYDAKGYKYTCTKTALCMIEHEIKHTTKTKYWAKSMYYKPK